MSSVIPAAILFDLDGTLADTAPDFFDVVNGLREQSGLPRLSNETIREQVSNGGAALTRLTWEINDDHPQFPQRRQQLLDQYEQVVGFSGKLFEGFDELLKRLGLLGISWGVVTNKPRLYTDLFLHRQGINSPVVICPEDVANRKPAPDALLKAAEHLNTEASLCWYVGDHIRDIEAAKAAGMTSIAACYGYIETHDNPDNWQADYQIHSANDLLSLIQ
ncbi:HAD family hydrolase [Thalassolituus marinus]|uniref:HAD-IA family hydrolase n=1 Tax=Thalassolituus marinus TaxID=671053 RepID=A0ABS7ZTI8_9GAMM|nr:HAD-IA family hydrolase [Thalassolituus marinus]MCA6065062.1 HAD-IA family hydrolase [Thalassolituus marinus]